MMHLFIVRHGETNANKEGYLQGWSNDPLNENGRILAEITGRNMKGIKFDSCISSPLIRARETAEIILHESENDAPIDFEDRIKEINFGAFERTNIREKKVTRFFHQPNINYKYPEGESILEVMERTQGFLKELINRDDGKVYLITTHGCALRAMLNYLYDNPSDFWHGHVPYNCCVNIIKVENGKARLISDDKLFYDPKYCVDLYA